MLFVSCRGRGRGFNYNYDSTILAPIPGHFQEDEYYTSLDPRPLFTKRPGIEASIYMYSVYLSGLLRNKREESGG